MPALFSFIRHFKINRTALAVGLYFTAWIIYFASFWSRALTIDKVGSLVAGHVNMWGDWAAHFTMGSSLGYRDLFLTTSPFMIGAPFAYPFAANGLSGLLIRLGVPFIQAFIWPSFIFSCVIVAALFFFYKSLFKSSAVAIIASLIFLLNGGIGFWYFGQDILNSSQPWQTAINPPHEYTRLDEQNIKWISVIDSMIIPQRAFNLGFPLTLIALSLIMTTFVDSSVKETSLKQHALNLAKKAFIPSLLLGFMPFIHTHSFLAAGIILAIWSGYLIVSLMVKKEWILARFEVYKWVGLAVMTSVIALPLLNFFFFNQVSGFIQWYPGWLAKEFNMNWLLFWFKNWGLTPLIGLIGWLTLALERKQILPSSLTNVTLFALLSPFMIIFLLANLWLFQPFSWDNTKLIVWASVGISGVAGYFIYGLWQEGTGLFQQLFTRCVATILFIVLVASGTIDAYWIQRVDLHNFAMYSQEELQLAEWAKTSTPIDAVWLTGDQHNHWLFNLTGRQAVMTYRGWLWTHGYSYLPVESDVSQMFTKPAQVELFKKYNVRYIVIGPNEITTWKANPALFELHHHLLQQTPNYSVFELRE